MQVALLVAAVLALALAAYGYNRLVTLRNRVGTAWADLDVQLERRSGLIPDLVAVVRGYAEHERATLEAVTAARAQGRRASAPGQRASEEAQVDDALAGLFAVAEAYPDLKADERFRELQIELVNTEDKVAFSRQLFNDTVTAYRNATQRFPTNVLARAGRFEAPELFATRDREAPGVSLR